MKIFLAKYEHKHGTDERAVKTRVGAEWLLAQWAEQYIDEWTPLSLEHSPLNNTFSQLVEQWTDITGGNEFLYIEELPLLDLKNLVAVHVKEK